MSFSDRNVHKDAEVAVKMLVVAIPTAVSQSDVVAYSHTPGFDFEILSVKSYCRVKAGTVTGQVKVGTGSVLQAAAVFTTATEVNAPLVASRAGRRGTRTQAINVHFTTDGTGALTNGFLTIRYRKRHLAGEG